MIKSFANDATKAVFDGRRGEDAWESFRKVAQRKLNMVHYAHVRSDLNNPPGNRLHRLERKRKGQDAIWINRQYRVCFIWKDGDAYNVEITDYHDDD